VVGDGYSALNGDDPEPVAPDAWTVLTFDGPTTTEDVESQIRLVPGMTAGYDPNYRVTPGDLLDTGATEQDDFDPDIVEWADVTTGYDPRIDGPR
jgi:hypothetical protein